MIATVMKRNNSDVSPASDYSDQENLEHALYLDSSRYQYLEEPGGHRIRHSSDNSTNSRPPSIR